jgi:hypothetical protein
MKFRRWIFAIALLLILPIAWTKLRYHLSEFEGGESIRNNGSWLFPRYRAQLRAVSLNRPGEHEYVLSGLPTKTFSLTFSIDGADQNSRRDVGRLRTVVGVTFTDQRNKQLCSANGSLESSRNKYNGTWVLAKSPTSAYFWIPQCTELPIRRGEQYRLKVRVDSIDPDSSKVDLIPILRGGGNELP